MPYRNPISAPGTPAGKLEGLLACLEAVHDAGSRRGVRHPSAVVLAMGALAEVRGCCAA